MDGGDASTHNAHERGEFQKSTTSFSFGEKRINTLLLHWRAHNTTHIVNYENNWEICISHNLQASDMTYTRNSLASNSTPVLSPKCSCKHNVSYKEATIHILTCLHNGVTATCRERQPSVEYVNNTTMLIVNISILIGNSTNESGWIRIMHQHAGTGISKKPTYTQHIMVMFFAIIPPKEHTFTYV